MKIFHGSSTAIKQPSYGAGKVGNDFGLGFYCTESEELAKEWSVRTMEDGFANAYTINTRGLNILNLNTAEFTVLNWMAILVTYRQFKSKTPIAATFSNPSCHALTHRYLSQGVHRMYMHDTTAPNRIYYATFGALNNYFIHH